VETRNVLKTLQYSDQPLHLIMLQTHHLDDSRGLMLQALSPANPPICLDITSIVGDVRREARLSQKIPRRLSRKVSTNAEQEQGNRTPEAEDRAARRERRSPTTSRNLSGTCEKHQRILET
jgi:hypothetical protein